jgi:hypothetical protein
LLKPTSAIYNKLPCRRTERLRHIGNKLPRNRLLGIVQRLGIHNISPPVREVLPAKAKGKSDKDNAKTRANVQCSGKNEIVLGCGKKLALVAMSSKIYVSNLHHHPKK